MVFESLLFRVKDLDKDVIYIEYFFTMQIQGRICASVSRILYLSISLVIKLDIHFY